MEPCKIFLAGNFLSSRAQTRSIIEDLMERLSRRGYSTIYASSYKNGLLRGINLVCTALFNRKHYDIAVIDVFSGRAFFWAEVLVYLLSRLNKPVIVVLRGGRLADFSLHSENRISRLLITATRVVTPSMYLQEYFRKLRADITYLPNGIEVDNYLFRPRIIHNPILIWLRSFHSIYQPEMAIRVLAFIKKDIPTVRLEMIGPDKKDGSLMLALRNADELDVRECLIIQGRVAKQDIPYFLNRGNIFLNTTRYESFGISVLEAALVGLPIVTTNVGELPFLWENEKTAMLVPPDDPEAMANAVKRILTEPALAQRLSQNARHKAEQFDWSVILPQWEALFQEVLNG